MPVRAVRRCACRLAARDRLSRRGRGGLVAVRGGARLFREARVELHHHAAARRLEVHVSRLRQLLDEIEERRGAVVALGEGGVELQQRALEQAGLRRDLAVGEDLQRAAHHREGLRDRRARRRGGHRPAGLDRGLPHAGQVLVRDELVAVALQDHARERAAADDEHFLVALLELFDEREEVAVAADDHVGVDVRVRERHLERVEREVDVGAVLVAARRHVALDEANRMLCERAAVLAGTRPVGVGDLGDHLAAFLDGVEDDPDVELLAEGGFDADFDVVEVDENGDVQTILMGQNSS